MKKCKECSVYVADVVDNCPICGAYAEHTSDNQEITFAPYPLNSNIKQSKVVRNIFLAISVIAIFVSILCGVLLKNNNITLITIATVAVAWINVLRYVFSFGSVKNTINGNAFWLTIYGMIATIIFGKIYIEFAYIVPTLLVILNISFMMMVFISGKWYVYAFSVFIISILEIVNLIICMICKYPVYLALPTALIGLSTLLFALIFGKNVLVTEIKKRFFI